MENTAVLSEHDYTFRSIHDSDRKCRAYLNPTNYAPDKCSVSTVSLVLFLSLFALSIRTAHEGMLGTMELSVISHSTNEA